MQRYILGAVLVLLAILAPGGGLGLAGFALASKRKVVAAVTDDAIAGDEIRRVESPSVVNMWASCVTKGDKVSLFLNKVEIYPSDNVNIEASADVIDTDRDQIVFNSFVGAGQLRVGVAAVTTELQFLLSVEPVLG